MFVVLGCVFFYGMTPWSIAIWLGVGAFVYVFGREGKHG
jgi:hypothetical protein